MKKLPKTTDDDDKQSHDHEDKNEVEDEGSNINDFSDDGINE